jgi:hypothetical protein
MLVRMLTILIQLYSQNDPERAESLSQYRDALTSLPTAL